jgi:hypothetical protein
MVNAQQSGELFRCYVCQRAFRWRAEISGRTLECKCGAKVRCPELHDGTSTAHEAIDDTATDVVLDEVFDDFTPGRAADEDNPVVRLSYARYRGIFGMRLGGEVIFYAVLSAVGLAFTALCIVTAVWENYRNFWPYMAGALVVGPYSWWRLRDRWRRFSRGKSVWRTLGDCFGEDEGDGAAA